jgi:hypothetical protein
MENLTIPKHCDSGSVLLINEAGALKRLYCPFRVECVVDTGTFKRQMWLWVEKVASNSKDELIYWILGKPYLYSHFLIHISF